jgi:hypothetical protein
MASVPVEPVDLLDLKLLPAWVKESAEAGSYPEYVGDEADQIQRGPERVGDMRRGGHRNRPPKGRHQTTPRRQQASSTKEGRIHRQYDDGRGFKRPDRPSRDRRPPRRQGVAHEEKRQKAPEAIARQVAIRFLPHPRVLENVIEQIKANTVAYSVFSLARLFLEKPERYNVRLTPSDGFSFYRLGQDGALSADRQFLENNAFRFAQEKFYKRETRQLEPIKGSFSGVARCRLSGVLLGPTNYHGYQPKLRSIYEQRFSRRMSFPDYQRKVEIVNDPALVEQWKEEARTVTTFSTLHEQNLSTFGNVAEAERHFRQNYLPGLVQETGETFIDGVSSRQMPDRVLRRLIEDTWSYETRSPSQMMQELAKAFREAGLHIFRHRRGMLFVSPIRIRPFAHDEAGVSPQVKAILEMLAQSPRASRKELADKLLADITSEEAESRKLALASDLHWLIREGYLIEFNDGTLDLPRTKVGARQSGGEVTSQQEHHVADTPTDAANSEAAAGATVEANEPPPAAASAAPSEQLQGELTENA